MGQMLRLAVFVAIAGCTHARPPPPRCPAELTLTVQSKTLGEKRVINVYLPPDYAKGSARYPVLYMLDGGLGEDFPHVAGSVDVSIKNAVIRPVIVVGIENTERRRDLIGPTTVADEQRAAPHAGGTARFRTFLRDEVKPLIAARYRVTNESALIGESLAGLFVVETFLVEPTLFDGYIAADPSVWWNEQAVIHDVNARLAAWSAGAKALYIATSEEQEGITALLAALRIVAPAGVTWTYEPMPSEHHNTIFPIAALRGIRTLFAVE